MNKGFSTWVMSKMVMLIFLFSLVAALGEYYMIYQQKTIDDTAKLVVQSIAEQISDALSYETTTRMIWLDSRIWVRDISRGYTLVFYYNSSESRLSILMAWNDHPNWGAINSYASAAGVSIIKPRFMSSNTPYSVSKVCFYNMNSNGKLTRKYGYMFEVRPSALSDSDRSNYLLVYKDDTKLCISNNNVNVDVKSGISALKQACEGCS